MGNQRGPFFFISLILGIIIVVISIYGFSLLRTRPGLPDEIKPSEVTRVDGVEVRRPEDLELALARKSVGEWVTVQIQKGPLNETQRTQIIPFYSRVPFPTIYLVIGLFSYLIGFLVFIFRWEDPKARILFWLALVFSFPLIVSGGTYCLRKSWITYFPSVLFFLSYPLAPALLVHFSSAFLKKHRTFFLALVYGISFLFGCAFVSLIFLSVLNYSLEIFRLYSLIFTLFRVYMVILLVLAIFQFVYAYRGTVLLEHKAQIKWIFLGLLLGLTPFIFLYQIPRTLAIPPLITEEVSSLPFVFIPLGFALSIFRFKFLNVEFVINRGLVYSILTIFTVSVYLFSVRVFQNLSARLFSAKEVTVSLGSALLAAVVFHPARKRIQEFVDRSFFRQSYDYKKAVLKFNDAAQKIIRQDELIDYSMTSIREIIPLNKLTVMLCAVTPGGFQLLYPREGAGAPDYALFSVLPSVRICARRAAVGTEEKLDFSQAEVLACRQLDMAFPLPFKSAALAGFLLAGGKKSGQEFTRDDIDLLLTLATELALNLERIQLHEEVIYERASKEKLDELSRLKTEFISTVSHELRTPLTSIQGLTEILQGGKIKDRDKKDEILATLASESGRLSRLLHNILDFGRIEQQTEICELQREEIGSLIKDAVNILQPQLEAGGFAVQLNIPSGPVFLDVDRDRIKQVLINLIDNAMKYSAECRRIEIALVDGTSSVELQVRDWGIGIAPKDQEKIFDRFFRAVNGVRVNPKGVGLGLKIAKHIVQAHGGEICVESRAGGGSVFRLVFPRREIS